MGDFNADLSPDGGSKACTPINEQGQILLRYLRKWSYCSYHLHLSPSHSTVTYESEAHGSVSMIDHLIGPTLAACLQGQFQQVASIKCYTVTFWPVISSRSLILQGQSLAAISFPKSDTKLLPEIATQQKRHSRGGGSTSCIVRSQLINGV